MEIILLERVAKLGNLGAKVKVKPGFARNFLFPGGKALPATDTNIAIFEKNREELERVSEERLKEAYSRASQLEGAVITLSAQASEEGRLFGSVGTSELVRAFAEAGHNVRKSEIRLPQGPFRQVGEYELELHLQGGEVIAKVNVVITQAE